MKMMYGKLLFYLLRTSERMKKNISDLSPWLSIVYKRDTITKRTTTAKIHGIAKEIASTFSHLSLNRFERI